MFKAMGLRRSSGWSFFVVLLLLSVSVNGDILGQYPGQLYQQGLTSSFQPQNRIYQSQQYQVQSPNSFVFNNGLSSTSSYFTRGSSPNFGLHPTAFTSQNYYETQTQTPQLQPQQLQYPTYSTNSIHLNAADKTGSYFPQNYYYQQEQPHAAQQPQQNSFHSSGQSTPQTITKVTYLSSVATVSPPKRKATKRVKSEGTERPRYFNPLSPHHEASPESLTSFTPSPPYFHQQQHYSTFLSGATPTNIGQSGGGGGGSTPGEGLLSSYRSGDQLQQIRGQSPTVGINSLVLRPNGQIGHYNPATYTQENTGATPTATSTISFNDQFFPQINTNSLPALEEPRTPLGSPAVIQSPAQPQLHQTLPPQYASQFSTQQSFPPTFPQGSEPENGYNPNHLAASYPEPPYESEFTNLPALQPQDQIELDAYLAKERKPLPPLLSTPVTTVETSKQLEEACAYPSAGNGCVEIRKK